MQTTLRNGAELLQQIGSVVLAKTGGYMPFVTWTVDADGNAYWGHYHKTLTEAAREFEERAGRS